jgi:hypothetical protein
MVRFENGKFVSQDAEAVLPGCNEPGASCDDIRRAAGFETSARTGNDFEFELEISRRLVSPGHFDYLIDGWDENGVIFEVYCSSEADATALLVQLGPWFLLARLGEILAAVELAVDPPERHEDGMVRFLRSLKR